MEAETLGDTRGDAQALVDTMADSIGELEEDTLGDTLSDASTLVDTLAGLRKQWSTRWLSRNQRWRQRRYATH